MAKHQLSKPSLNQFDIKDINWGEDIALVELTASEDKQTPQTRHDEKIDEIAKLS